MGHSSTIVLCFGIKINEGVAKAISDSFPSDGNDWDMAPTEEKVWRQVCASYHREVPAQLYPISKFSHTPVSYQAIVLDLQLFSNGTDSRIHSLRYDKGHEHFLGLFVGKQGYGLSDDISALTSDAYHYSKYFEDRYKLLVSNIAAQFNLSDKPALHFLSQIH